ncbi:hypothetical protein K461DRAFT_277560 [Myriangium duriaei CBS 260.36]|uniref:Uncharacterized protein n=1 Tax=Myriangium duriaei CBS 260.36 TaxID=1168546 RepID=A0A9P4MIQ0_9PEZI|nr:hypothetical protein K461DRAFT_277560 [Myriangium duriaei CBS 260.36]
MLYSILTPLLIAWYTAQSTAAPLLQDSPAADATQSQSYPSGWPLDIGTPLDTATPWIDSTSELSSNQADIAVACQACGENGADAYPVFDFKIEHASVQDCSIACAINGSTVHLSEAHPTSSLSVEAPNQAGYLLRAELYCKSENIDGLVVNSPVVSFYLDPVEAPSAGKAGFTIAATASGHISSITLFSRVSTGELSAIPSLPSTGSKEDALEIIRKVEALHHILSDQLNNHVPPNPDDSQSPETLSAAEQTQTSHTAEQCITRFKQEAACAARRASKGVADRILSLLNQLGPSIGEDRAARYSDHVQSAMLAVENHFDCDKKKSEKEAIKVTVTEVSADIDQAPTTKTIDQKVDLSKVPKRLIQALEVLAAALGLGGLFAFLRRRYCSLRRRVERLADREERIKAREYRRAARKEQRRRRWAAIKNSLTSCFTGGSSKDDEEKLGLIMNAAEEGHSDMTIGAAMSHLDGLHYAHDVAVQMAQAGHFAALGPRFHGTSGGLVQQVLDSAMGRTHGQTRSRASSLPSYNSEVLPDYSSQPDESEMVQRSARVVDGMRRPASRTSTTGSSRFTPGSSIPDISPRPSIETLRTQGTEEV